MTTLEHPSPSIDGLNFTLDPAKPRRKVRGLRLTAAPSMPLVAQLVGGGAALAGSFLQFGAGITLIGGGIAAVVLGMLREAGRI